VLPFDLSASTGAVGEPVGATIDPG
jgi:hypothetical protein